MIYGTSLKREWKFAAAVSVPVASIQSSIASQDVDADTVSCFVATELTFAEINCIRRASNIVILSY